MLRILLISVFFLAASTSVVQAQEIEPEPEPTPPRVAVSPLSYHPQDPQLDSGAVVGAVHDGLASAFRSSRQTTVIDREQLVTTMQGQPLYERTVQLGDSWATMGIDAYKGLDLDGAVRSLRESIDSFREVGHDLVDPARFAELLMFLSVSHLERKSQMVEPLDRMQEMILYDPGRVLERGFYPERVVQFYESARVALERDLQRGPDPVLSARLAEQLESDFVASAYILERNGGYEMVGYLWDAADGETMPAESVPIDSLDPEVVREAANRLGTRLIACIALPDADSAPIKPSEGRSPLALQVSFAYASFFEFPGPAWTRPFANLGASFGVGWQFTREFSIVGALQILTSTSEFSGALLEDFTTLRSFGGIDLGWDFWRFSVGLSTQLELTKVGDITTCNAVDGPTQQDPDCSLNRGTYESPILVGVNARPRLSYSLLSSVELQATGSLSYFFVPLNDRELNFPITVEAGLVYRF